MEADRKVTVYDKGVSLPPTDTYGEYVGIRTGDIWIPKVASDEPLRLECQEFVAAVQEGRAPVADGRAGLAVVEVLEAMQRSLERGGETVALDPALLP
jgi:predicted dehydrogenase